MAGKRLPPLFGLEDLTKADDSYARLMIIRVLMNAIRTGVSVETEL